MNATTWFETPPADWKIKRVKYASPLQTTRSDVSSDAPNYIGLENVESWTGRYIEIGNLTQIESGVSELQGTSISFKAGDVLFGKLRPYLAKALLAQVEGVGTTEFLVLRPHDELDANFLLYVLLSSNFVSLVSSSTFGAKMPRASWDFIGSITIPVPPLDTQRHIADYLDAETAQIDALIAEKERMLALLAEKRGALVSQAVTQGLDPTVPMKPSRLEWLGRIPAHWKVMRFKHFCKIGNGSTPHRDNPLYWEGGDYPWLNSSVVNNRKVAEISRYVTEPALIECHLPKIKPPALLVAITGQGKTRGKSTVLEFEATINQHLAYIKPQKDSANCLYLSYLLDTAYEFIRSDSDGAGSTRGAITCEQLGNFYISLPPLMEQLKILNFIDEEISEFDQVEEDLRLSLSLLKERRSALITAAVTGQLEEESLAR